ncbi:hypothetical protein ACI2K4_06070 [Micromonospora sp. NPDC050397]|uniref:hypothetical protein n=1 Tax=Micromonospora sp. NPDC050397 TaxID=3364279 RepID=UPI003850534E
MDKSDNTSPSEAIGLMWAAVRRALADAGDPSPARIEQLSVELPGVDRLSDSTVSGWFEHWSAVPAWSSFHTLIVCLDAERAEDWKALHTAALTERNRRRTRRGTTKEPGRTPTGPQPPTATEPASEPQPTGVGQPRRRRALSAATAAGALVSTAAVVFFWQWPRSQGEPSTAPTTLSARTWPAKVANTWSATQTEWKGFRGSSVYGDPYETGRGSKVGAYEEGRAIQVACQERAGRPITDPNRDLTSPVWNRLVEGVWIPDLYTDLPTSEGPTPPLGIPPCPRPSP